MHKGLPFLQQVRGRSGHGTLSRAADRPLSLVAAFLDIHDGEKLSVLLPGISQRQNRDGELGISLSPHNLFLNEEYSLSVVLGNHSVIFPHSLSFGWLTFGELHFNLRLCAGILNCIKGFLRDAR